MICDDAKILLVTHLYGEIEESEEEALKDHLSSCEACSAEMEALQKTSHLLRTWEDVDPRLRLHFVRGKPRISSWWPRLARFPRWGGLTAGLAAAALLLMALMNLEVSYGEGGLDFRVSLLPRPVALAPSAQEDSTEAARYVTPEMLAEVQQENYRLMQKLIEASEVRQAEFVNDNFRQFAAEVEAQRRRDLHLVDRGFEAFQSSTARQIEETQQILGDLVRLTRYSYQESGKP